MGHIHVSVTNEVTPLITPKILIDVDHSSTRMTLNRTGSLTYMSDQTSKLNIIFGVYKTKNVFTVTQFVLTVLEILIVNLCSKNHDLLVLFVFLVQSTGEGDQGHGWSYEVQDSQELNQNVLTSHGRSIVQTDSLTLVNLSFFIVQSTESGQIST